MPYRDFQTEAPGNQLVLPYAIGPGATIVRVQSASGPSGHIRSDGGFVGLDVGDRATIVFDPPAEAFRLYMLCGANPTVATIVDEDGMTHPSITLIKGPLNTGRLAYATSGAAMINLEHSSREGMLLRLDWDNREDAVGISSICPAASHGAASHESIASALYARTAGWRAVPENAVQLEEARIELASSILLAGMVGVEGIVPTENDLKHPMIRRIWEACMTAAALAMSTRKHTEIAVIERYSGGGMSGLGPFVDLNSRGAEIMVVLKPTNPDLARRLTNMA